jgi:DNA-binding transcriptional ArsR family regulator
MQAAERIDVFQALASPTRRELIGLLRVGEVPATILAERFDLTQPAISQQLRVLREAGLVAERRVGRQRLYHLNPAPLMQVAGWLSQYEHFWQGRLDSLDAFMRERSRHAPRETRHAPKRRRRSTR